MCLKKSLLFAWCLGGSCVPQSSSVCGWSRRHNFYHVHHVSREETFCAHVVYLRLTKRWSITHLAPLLITQLWLLWIYSILCVCTHLVLSSRSSSYPFSDSPLYSQTPPSSSSTYYEATPNSESDITTSVASQPVSVATGAANSGAAAAGGAGYVIQGSYVLGGGGAAAGGGGGGQSYSSPNSRAPPATVSAQVMKKIFGHNVTWWFRKINSVIVYYLSLGAMALW